MRFLVDNQLPAALARFLDANGIEALHVLDIGLDTATDREIWAYAKMHRFTVISKDDDFFHLATMDSSGPALIWVRFGNCRKAVLLAKFKDFLPQLIEMLRTGQKVIEIG
jgi:predicted nuclease of predicted toxin-antitoxin system